MTAKRSTFLRSIPARQDREGWGAFTQEQVAAFNARHDRVYGWSPKMTVCYTNPLRIAGVVLAQPVGQEFA